MILRRGNGIVDKEFDLTFEVLMSLETKQIMM